MARYGFPALRIVLEDEVAGDNNISAYVTTINGWKKSQAVEELTAAGDVNERWITVGINMADPVVLTGPYDDAADGLVDTTEDPAFWGTIRTLTLTLDMVGAADIQTVECYIESVENKPERGKFHAYTVTLQPTGNVA